MVKTKKEIQCSKCKEYGHNKTNRNCIAKTAKRSSFFDKWKNNKTLVQSTEKKEDFSLFLEYEEDSSTVSSQKSDEDYDSDVSLFSSASQVDRAIQKYQEDEDDESWASGLDLSGCNESDMIAYSRLRGYYRYMDEWESSL